MSGKFALVIGNSRYNDGSLGRLKAPDIDVHELASVLKSPDVGRFDEVATLLNEDCASVRKAIARFYDQRQRDDLLLLYFSGHGVKDEQGHLYLAVRDTESRLPAGSAIETAFITGRMDRCFPSLLPELLRTSVFLEAPGARARLLPQRRLCARRQGRAGRQRWHGGSVRGNRPGTSRADRHRFNPVRVGG